MFLHLTESVTDVVVACYKPQPKPVEVDNNDMDNIAYTDKASFEKFSKNVRDMRKICPFYKDLHDANINNLMNLVQLKQKYFDHSEF